MTNVEVIAQEPLLTDKHYWQSLGQFWADGLALLVFLRHFGSAFALEQIDELGSAQNELAAAGVTTVLVGWGMPREAATFRAVTKTSLPILVDESAKLYRRLGLLRAPFFLAKPSDVVRWLRSKRKRFALADWAQRRQLGGSFLVAASGQVVEEHRDQTISHITRHGDIVRMLDRLTAVQV